MSVKFSAVKCPECGASLQVEEGRERIFCSYCGASIIMTNENEHIYRHINEAEIKRAEVEETIQMKKLDIMEQSRVSEEKRKKTKVAISILLGIISIFLMLAGGGGTASMIGLLIFIVIGLIWMENDNDKENDIDIGDKIKVPEAISGYENKNYSAIESIFISAGFTNIKCVPLNDLRTGLLKKPGMVESITINGKSITSGGKKCKPDASVVIAYHSFSEK